VDGKNRVTVDAVLLSEEPFDSFPFVPGKDFRVCVDRLAVESSAGVTEGDPDVRSRRIRLTLYESASVSTSRRPSSPANQTGVATPLPSRLKLVRLRYLPSKRSI
jgi:hypothetical protein